MTPERLAEIWREAATGHAVIAERRAAEMVERLEKMVKEVPRRLFLDF